MQIKGVNDGIYKLYSYARKQECLDAYREKYSKIVDSGDKLKAPGAKESRLPDLISCSRTTHFKAKRPLKKCC